MSRQNRVTRRRFLGSASVLAASPYVVSAAALGAEGKPPASERITSALIGCGGRGNPVGNELLGVGTQMLAACDCRKDRRDRWAERIKGQAYADFREVLARDDIDVVGIATPDHWHVPMTIAAAKAGKDVYCEKPLGMSIHEDKLCREVLRRYGRVFQFGTQWKSSGHCRFACELVRNGKLGQLREIRVFIRKGLTGGSVKPVAVPAGLDWDLWLGPAPWRPYNGSYASGGDGWWYTYDFALGFMTCAGIHPVAYAIWGFDTHLHGPFEVEGTGVIGEGARDALAKWDAKFTFANGVTLTLKSTDSNAWSNHAEYWQFIGTEGRLEVDYGRITLAEPESLLKAPIGPGDIQLPKSRGHMQDFLDAVRSRGKTVAPIDDAFQADVLCHLADIAIRLGRKIRWDPVKEEIVGDAEATRMMTRSWREPWGQYLT
ncbi:MAG: Gfo/Idh/MocA family oxidoreductase [Thermoguttaceae bacterium]|jgi:predicted dehydrogenase